MDPVCHFLSTYRLAALFAVITLFAREASGQTPPTNTGSASGGPRQTSQRESPARSTSQRPFGPPNPSTSGLQFPGDALFNTNPSFFTGVVVDHKDLVYQEGEKLRIQFGVPQESWALREECNLFKEEAQR